MSTNIKDLIVCSICFDKYRKNIKEKKPICLNCGHTFCAECVLKLNNSSKLKCPNDNREFEFDGNVDSLTINRFVLTLLDSFCDTCDNSVDENSFFCRDCALRICNNCKSDHFNSYKKNLLEKLKQKNKCLKELISNSRNLEHKLKVDLEIAKIYLNKDILRIKWEKQAEIKKIVEDFISKYQLIYEKLVKQIEIIEENNAKCLCLLDELNIINFINQDSSFESLAWVSKKLKPINEYNPHLLCNEIDIIEKKYTVKNPIIENQKSWFQYALEINKLNEKYDPEKLFEFTKNDIEDTKKINVSIGVVGRAKVGKSSFINAFFNLCPEDPLYIKTNFNECTDSPRLYNYQKNSFENVNIWDTPGVGTELFKLSNYNKDVLENINCIAYIYLYDTQFDQVDKKVVQMIRNKNVPIFICRTKIDKDYISRIEKIETKHYRQINLEKRKLYSSPGSNEYKKVFDKLRNSYEEDRRDNNLLLKDESVYYLSTKDGFRDLFEFNLFIIKLAEKLPKLQSNLVIYLVQTKNLELLEKKKDIIKKEIKPIFESMIKNNQFSNIEEYRRYLNASIQEFARRLGLNELFKEVDNSEFGRIVKQIEDNISIELESIKNKNHYSASSKVNTSMSLDFSFYLRSFSSFKDMLIKETCLFLENNLESLFKNSVEIFKSYYLTKREADE